MIVFTNAHNFEQSFTNPSYHTKQMRKIHFHPKPSSSEKICRKRGMSDCTEHIFKTFFKTQTPMPRTRWTVRLAVSTILISLRYTNIKFQRAKHLITFHNERSTVVTQPNMKHSSLQILHKPLLIYLIWWTMKSSFPFRHLSKM